MERDEIFEEDNKKLITSLRTVITSFSDRPEIAAIFFQTMLSDINPVNNQEVEEIFSRIANAYTKQKVLAEKVIESLKNIRRISHKNKNFRELVELQIDGLIQSKAILDYVTDTEWRVA